LIIAKVLDAGNSMRARGHILLIRQTRAASLCQTLKKRESPVYIILVETGGFHCSSIDFILAAIVIGVNGGDHRSVVVIVVIAKKALKRFN
jgi:hypoxanthine-guanine phosphoribosyltransferase